jgi:hypothetical protein
MVVTIESPQGPNSADTPAIIDAITTAAAGPSVSTGR